MPFVNIRTARGLLSGERKRELQVRVTDLMVELAGGGDPAFRPFVWVMIEEAPPESWCVGGIQVTPDLVGRLAGHPETGQG